MYLSKRQWDFTKLLGRQTPDLLEIMSIDFSLYTVKIYKMCETIPQEEIEMALGDVTC